MSEIVAAFLRRKLIQNAAAQIPKFVDSAFGTIAE
jgi:hypothetical protein